MSLLFVLSTWAAAGGRKKAAKQTITKMRKVRSASVVRSAAFVGFCFVFLHNGSFCAAWECVFPIAAEFRLRSIVRAFT